MNPIIQVRVRAAATQVRHDARMAAPSAAALVRSLAKALAGTGSIMVLRARRAWQTGAPSSDITRAHAAQAAHKREGVGS